MSGLLPGIDPRSQIGGASGVGGIDGSGGASNDIGLGQFVGGLGAMDLLGTKRGMDIRSNAIDLALALQKNRDRSAKQVIDSIA